MENRRALIILVTLSIVLGISNYAMASPESYMAGYVEGSGDLYSVIASNSNNFSCAYYLGGGSVCSTCPEEFTHVCNYPIMEGIIVTACYNPDDSDYQLGCTQGAEAALADSGGVCSNGNVCDLP